MADESYGFKPFNFEELQRQADNGELDFIAVYRSDGTVIDYAPVEGEVTVTDLRDGPSKHPATLVRFVASSSVYWYCDPEDKKWVKCKVRNGVETCRKTRIPCDPTPE